MATLNKIREKQGCLVFVIGAALALFILSANPFQSTGCSRNQGTELVAGGVKTNREKVDNMVQLYTDMYKNSGRSNPNNDMLRQMVIMQVAQQEMVNNECKNLGISISPQFLGQLMELDPDGMAQMFYTQIGEILKSNPNIQIADLQQLRYLLDNPKGQDEQVIAQLRKIWVDREEAISDWYNSEVFFNLVNGLYTANNIDAKSVYDLTGQSTVAYVTTNVTALDKDAEATQAEKQAVYDDLKLQYYVPTYRAKFQPNGLFASYEEPVRVVDVAAISIMPSADDKAKTYADFSQFVSDLRDNDGFAAAPAGVTQETVADFSSNLAKIPALQQMLNLPADSLAKVLASDTVYFRTSNASDAQHYAMAVSNVEERVDSVQASFRIALNAAPADTVEATQMWILPATENVELANTLFGQYAMLVPAIQTDRAAFDAFSATLTKINDLALTAEVNTPVEYVDTVNKIHLAMSVDKRNAKTPYASVTIYSTQAMPSDQTLSDLREAMINFSTNASAENMVDSAFVNLNVGSVPYTSRLEFVSASSPYILVSDNYTRQSYPIENSRQAVKWAMEKKVGDISPIFENNDVIYVLAIREDISGNFIPMNSPLIENEIEHLAINQHNGNEMMAKYSGTTLAELAKSMNREQETVTDPSFTLYNGTSTLSTTPQLRGKVAGAKPGKLVGPFVVNDKIFAFSVIEHNEPQMPFDPAYFQNQFVRDYSPAANPFMMLVGKGKVKNETLKYVSTNEDLENQRAMQQ